MRSCNKVSTRNYSIRPKSYCSMRLVFHPSLFFSDNLHLSVYSPPPAPFLFVYPYTAHNTSCTMHHALALCPMLFAPPSCPLWSLVTTVPSSQLLAAQSSLASSEGLQDSMPPPGGMVIIIGSSHLARMLQAIGVITIPHIHGPLLDEPLMLTPH